MRRGFRWGNLRKTGHFEELVVDGRILLKRIFNNGVRGGIDWMDLAPDKDGWRDVVNAVMNLVVP